MDNYYINRTIRAISTVWVVVTLTFVLVRYLPGGPLVQLRGELLRSGVEPEQVNTIIENYQGIQPDLPIHQQYLEYMMGLAQGDLGTSLTMSIGGNDAVAAIIADALPWTILVMVTATVLTFTIGIVAGSLMAYKEGELFDTASTIVGITLSSVPFYIFAILLVWLLAYQHSIFPPRGRISSAVQTGDVSVITFFIDALYHAALPIISVVLTGWGVQALSMRGNSIQVLGEDYVKVARLRGLSDNRIATRYVARNAILPMYTGFITVVGFNLGGSVILEEVFSYPGVGYYMFGALENRDYPVIVGIFLMITIAVVIALYIADITYGIIDPRVSTGDSDETY